MTRINMARVILGGVVAGLILNVGEVVLHKVVIAEEMEAAVQARNLPPVGGSAYDRSRIPLVRAPKQRTPRTAWGEAARLSSNRVNAGVTSQSMS